MKKATDPARARWLKTRHKARLKRRRARPLDTEALWVGDLLAPWESPTSRFRKIREALDRVVEARAELPHLPSGSLPWVLATTLIRHSLSEATANARMKYDGAALDRVLGIIDRYR